MDSRSSRRRVFEFNSSLNYLDIVAREIRVYFQKSATKDAFLDRVYSKISLSHIQNGVFGLSCFFRFSSGSQKHWRGEIYEYRKRGTLALVSAIPVTPKARVEYFLQEPLDVTIAEPDDLTGKDLFDGIQSLTVQQVLSG